MNENKISVRYARALYDLVKEDNAMDALRQDMELLSQCIRDIPELRHIIQSPVIRVSEKTKIFAEIFKASFNPLTSKFINLVLEHRREEYLAGIARYFLDLLKTDQGIRSAEVVTAKPLDDKLRQSVIQFITRKYKARVELTEEVDESLIGGFILRVGDQQIDASISSKLKRIREELTDSQLC
jgi:F-type H+-transporting ATPase subunit delta